MLATIDPGDEVIIPEPCFVAYQAAVVFAGGVPVHVGTSVEQAFQVTGAAIEAAITPRTRAILIGYPNNPTGAVMPRERLAEIAAIADRHDLLVFSDEIYDRLIYGVEHTCLASLPGMRERTVLLGGFSKAYAMTGWRLGWLAAPADVTAATRKIHQYAIMSAPTMAQYAGLEALQNGEGAVQTMVAEYDRRRQVIVSGLNTIGLPTFEPQGAFYAFRGWTTWASPARSSPSGCCTSSMSRWCQAMRLARAAPALCAPATRRRWTRSRRPSIRSTALCARCAERPPTTDD